MGTLADIRPDFCAMRYEDKLDNIRKIRAERVVRQPSPTAKKRQATAKVKGMDGLRKAIAGMTKEQIAAALGVELPTDGEGE